MFTYDVASNHCVDDPSLVAWVKSTLLMAGQLATRPQTATIYSMITNGAKRYESLSVASC